MKNIRKIVVFTVLALLPVSANADMTAAQAHAAFLKICADDVTKSKITDCSCQADQVDDQLDDAEMIAFVGYLSAGTSDSPEKASYSAKPEFKTAFKKIAASGAANKDKCLIK